MQTVSCAHQDLSDLTAHCSGKIHRSFERPLKTTRNLRGLKGFETEADTNLAGQTIRAEVMHTNFMVHYKISFPYCWTFIAFICSDISWFKNSIKIFKCSRTKTASILNYAMMPALKSLLLDIIKQPYTLVNDGTSDTGLKKMNLVCCQIFGVDTSKRVEF